MISFTMCNTWHLPTLTDSCQLQHHWCKRSSTDCSEKLSRLGSQGGGVCTANGETVKAIRVEIDIIYTDLDLLCIDILNRLTCLVYLCE